MVILELYMQGCVYREIAEQTGKTIPWISRVVNDPLAREYINTRLQGMQRDFDVLRSGAVNAVRGALGAVNNTGGVAHGTRLQAARLFFDAQGDLGGENASGAASGETAEDFARRVVQVNVNVGLGKDEEGPPRPPVVINQASEQLVDD